MQEDDLVKWYWMDGKHLDKPTPRYKVLGKLANTFRDKKAGNWLLIRRITDGKIYEILEQDLTSADDHNAEVMCEHI